MRCKELYRENWEEEWGVGGNESKDSRRGGNMLGLKRAGEEPDCNRMLGSPGQDSEKGSQRSGTSKICVLSTFKTPTPRFIIGWGRGWGRSKTEG